MNISVNATHARKTAAEWLASFYPSTENLEAIAISGSTARGGADDWSDIELALFWKQAPSDGMRLDPIHKAGGNISRKIFSDSDYFYAVENFKIGDLCFDVVHNLSPRFFSLVDQVVNQHDTNPKKQEVVAMASCFIGLRGEALVKMFQEQSKPYSDAFQKKALEKLEFPTPNQLNIHSERRDTIAFHKCLTNGVEQMLQALCAINRRYYPGSKRAHWLVDSLELKPNDLLSKMEQVFFGDYAQSKKIFESLVGETMELLPETLNLKESIQTRRLDVRRVKLTPSQIDGAIK
jgi:hypothetical protein